MISARSLFQEIHDNDDSFRLFCSIAAKGEDQGGWENGRIAALVTDQVLAPKIARHGADEDKHGRIFSGLMHKRGLQPVGVPDSTDYTMLLERQGIGLAHSRLRRGAADRSRRPRLPRAQPGHRAARVRADAAAGQGLRQGPRIGRAVRMISADEDNHLAYCHEELLRLTAAGHGPEILDVLHRTARAEISTYRDVSLAVMARMGAILHWSRPKSAVLALGIHLTYLYDRLGGWRRMTSLRAPAIHNPLGEPAPA